MTTEETVRKALEQIRKRPANHDYFFSKLNSPEWLDPLSQAGLFARAPDAVREGDTISFPFWPESQYLYRMADSAPQKVAELMLKLPETDNIRVHEDFAKAAIKLPVRLAADWADKEARWVEKQRYLYFMLPVVLGELASRLARDGAPQIGLRLARALLSPRANDASAQDRRAEFRFDDWHYEQILRQHIPGLVSATGIAALQILLDVIDDVSASQDDDDYSWLWRPAIESHEQNYRHGDLRNALIDAARDAIDTLADREYVSDVLNELNSRKRSVFKRLALHMLSKRPDQPLATTEAMSKANFADVRVWHEYSRLLCAVFPRLNETQAGEVLGWIEEGPPPPQSEQLGPEALVARKAGWQLGRLAVLRQHLPTAWEEKYTRLAAMMGGEPPHPDLLTFHTSWAGPSSPKDEAELESMSAEAVADYLKHWSPDGTWRSPDPEGLARVLQAVIAKSAARFVSSLRAFLGVDPTYSRAIVLALSDAVKTNTALDWSAIVGYLEWIVDQPRHASDPESGSLSRDPHWGWARRATASLLSVAFQKDVLPFQLRERAWGLLGRLTNDPDPTIKDDSSTMDPATLSINTTRGEALHAVIQYALFVRRKLEAEGNVRQRAPNFHQMPEVKDCLERHLNPAIDPSPAIRSIYGQWIPWLMLLDDEWLKEHIESIFPEHDPLLRDAAWDTYLKFCPAYEEVFLALRGQYDAAITRLRDQGQKRGRDDTAQGEARLGEHLMALVGRGVLSWDDPDHMLQRYFAHAPVHAASEAIAFVGRSLHEAHESMSPEIVNRFCRLWENLAAFLLSAERADWRDLLRSFGSWFGAPGLDPQWAFDKLDAVLNDAGDVEPNYLVIEGLSDLAQAYPSRSLKLLRKLITTSKDKWVVLAGDESIRTLLTAALDDAETHADAVALVHELGARGYTAFRSLLVK